MARIVLCLLLLPAMLFGQIESAEKASGFRVEKQEIQRIEKPTAKAVEVKERRTETGKVFDLGITNAKGEKVMQAVIGAAPIHRDSAGVMVEYDLSDKAAKTLTKDAGKAARIGASTVEYDTTGRFRWEKDGSWFSLSPVFKTGTVGIKMRIEPGQVKTDYILDEKSPTRLAWGLKESWKGVAERKISPPIAWDAEGKPVPVEQIFTSDSLIWSADTKGAVWPICIDPTVQDTTTAGNLLLNRGNWGTFAATRDSAHANTVSSPRNVGMLFNGSIYQIRRAPLRFALNEHPMPAAVDSVRLVLVVSAVPTADTTRIVAVAAEFLDTVKAGWWNDFPGWASSGAYSTTDYVDQPFKVGVGSATGARSFLLNAAGREAVRLRQGTADTLDIMLIDQKDRDNVSTGLVNNAFTTMGTAPYAYLVIHYVAGDPPTVSTVADTAFAAAVLVGRIDTTGGVNLTARGFEYTTGDADTLSVSESGLFGAGEYSLLVSKLAVSTTYYFRAFGTNSNGTDYSAFSSFATSGGGVVVDGRIVNTRK